MDKRFENALCSIGQRLENVDKSSHLLEMREDNWK